MRDSMIKNAIEGIKEIIKKGSYIEGFHWPNKDVEALGVVKSLFESMEVNGEVLFCCPSSYKPDPPDCIAKDGEGNIVGFEVTTLDDFEEIKENVKGKSVYRDWTSEEAIKEIQKKLNEKDTKVFNGGPYSKNIIILHTHNCVIEQECLDAIKQNSFSPLKQLTDAYLLFWYNAAIKRYPYIKLKFK
jgi:hypothetical protein